MQTKVAVIGGGAAGFFGAINIAELNENIEVHIFEKGNAFLSKVKISGGGRCNVTHACFDPNLLIKNYPRGSKELLGSFYVFNPEHTVNWFKERGVDLKQEADGRMFPASNSSQTIIDCFLNIAHKKNMYLHLQTGIQSIEKLSNKTWQLHLSNNKLFVCNKLLIASGSSNHLWSCLSSLLHTIEAPVPSLFTFNIKDARIGELMGVSIAHVSCSIVGSKMKIEGPLLITHWGLSGPAILKLSAWAARDLNRVNYHFQLQINFNPQHNFISCCELFLGFKHSFPKKAIHQTIEMQIPSRLFKNLCLFVGISEKVNWADITKEKLQQLAKVVTESIFTVTSKSNFKDEFVTCGGVKLQEVDFRTMKSKIHPNLFFVGEVLNIDAITGGFNFQAAWTTGFIAAHAIAEIEI